MATNEIQNGRESSIEAVLASNHKRRCVLRPGAACRYPGRRKQFPSRPHARNPKVQFPQRSRTNEEIGKAGRLRLHWLKAPIPVAPPRPFSATAIDPSVFRFFPAHSPARSPLELTLEPPPRVHGEHFANAFLSLLSPATEIANSAVPPDHQLTGAKSLVSNWLA